MLLVAVPLLIFVVGIHDLAYAREGHKDMTVFAICCDRVGIPRVDARYQAIGLEVDHEHRLIPEINVLVSRAVPNLVASYSWDLCQSGSSPRVKYHTRGQPEPL